MGILERRFRKSLRNLQRKIMELLTRPVGRPSHKPVFRFNSFLYQAASWTMTRRVVAKVEFHSGELFARVGFIVTNLGTSSITSGTCGDGWCCSRGSGSGR